MVTIALSLIFIVVLSWEFSTHAYVQAFVSLLLTHALGLFRLT